MTADIPANIAKQVKAASAYPCPLCQGPTGVNDSRGALIGIRRRRVCRSCGYRFTTYETELSDSGKFTELLQGLLILSEKSETAAMNVSSEIERMIGVAMSVRELEESRYGGATVNRNPPTPQRNEP